MAGKKNRRQVPSTDRTNIEFKPRPIVEPDPVLIQAKIDSNKAQILALQVPAEAKLPTAGDMILNQRPQTLIGRKQRSIEHIMQDVE